MRRVHAHMHTCTHAHMQKERKREKRERVKTKRRKGNKAVKPRMAREKEGGTKPKEANNQQQDEKRTNKDSNTSIASIKAPHT